MRFVRQLLIVLCAQLFFLMAPVLAAENTDSKPRPRVGLVLSGGGALGLAHIGTLEVLEELRVPVDCVVGTSMGALVGGAYAAGVSPTQMHEAIVATDLVAMFDDNPPRSELSQYFKSDDYKSMFNFTLGFNDWEVQLPTGASAGYKFELFLKEMMGQTAALSNLVFDDLPTPYRAIGTDLETGGMVVFDSGELSRIMRASMSLPAIIAPVEVAGRVYIDGGLSRNLPVDIGRELCGDVLIAVNLGTKPKTHDQIHNSLEVAYQSIVILTEQNVNESIAELTSNDVLIEPDLDEFDSSSFTSQREIIQRGIEAGRANQEALAKLSVSPEAYQAWQDERQRKIPPSVTPTSIRVETEGVVNDEAVLRDIKTEMGDMYDPKQLHEDIVEIYGRGDFSYIGYSIATDEQDVTAVIEADSKPWGPGYLKLGLGTATDFNGPTEMNVSASYRRTWINSLGAEWRTDLQLGYDSFLRTAFMQPLQVRDGAFVTPYVEGTRRFVQFYDKTLRLGDIQVRRAQAGLDFGVTGKLGEVKFGPYINHTNSIPDFGVITPILPQQRARQVGVELTAVYDQLDSFSFPRSGMFASLNVQNTNKDWNADDEYTRAQVTLSGATSIGKHTVAVDLEWGDELGGADELPVYANFQLGGPKRLSGLYLDQLTGSHYSLATLSVYHQYSTLPSQLGRGLYVGLSMEAGKINDTFMEDPSEWISAGSIYWGAETILGVAYIGYGFTSQNQSAWYLTIGPRF